MKKLFLLCLAIAALVSVSVSAQQKRSGLELERATVTITYDGMIALCMGDANRASAGFLALPDHHPLMVIKRIQGAQEREVLRLAGKELAGALTVAVEGRENNISRYQPGAVRSDARDFRWLVDMETDLFNKQLFVREAALAGKIHFTDGVFYSWRLSDKPWQFVAGEQRAAFQPRHIGEPAAAIELAAGQALVISGAGKRIVLPFEVGASYEISVTNLPARDAMNMNHWLHYYDAIEAQVTRYEPIEVDKAAYNIPPMMCGPSYFSKSKLN